MIPIKLRVVKRKLSRSSPLFLDMAKVCCIVAVTILFTLHLAPHVTQSSESDVPLIFGKSHIVSISSPQSYTFNRVTRVSRETKREFPVKSSTSDSPTEDNLGKHNTEQKTKADKHDKYVKYERNATAKINKTRSPPATKGSASDVHNVKKSIKMQYRIFQTRQTIFDHKFILTAENVCKDVKKPFLLITVLSTHLHVKIRESIRNTYGSIARTGKWKNTTVAQNVRLVFLFGRGKLEKHDQIVQNESLFYGDIVQADFIDSYFNLTHKSVMGIRWASLYCNQTKFILKADEDVFVHVSNLINYLKVRHVPQKGMMFGHAQVSSPVLRTGKWAVSNSTYPFPRYPTYLCGNTYVISGNIASRIVNVSGYLPFLNIEDVFVTGIIRTRISASVVNHIGFTHWYQNEPKTCEFQNKIRFSATKVHLRLRYLLWDAIGSNMTDCFNTTKIKTSNIHPIPNSPLFKQNKIEELKVAIRDEHVFYNKTGDNFFIKH